MWSSLFSMNGPQWLSMNRWSQTLVFNIMNVTVIFILIVTELNNFLATFHSLTIADVLKYKSSFVYLPWSLWTHFSASSAYLYTKNANPGGFLKSKTYDILTEKKWFDIRVQQPTSTNTLKRVLSRVS